MAKRKPAPRYTCAERVARLRAVAELACVGSDAEFSPILVGEAASIHDMLADRDLEGRSWFDRQNAREWDLYEHPPDPTIDEWLAYRRAGAALRALLRHAVEIASVAKGISRPRVAWLAAGIRTSIDARECQYYCLFCGENLATLANGGGTVPRAFTDKLERHTHPCAMKYLSAPGSRLFA